MSIIEEIQFQAQLYANCREAELPDFAFVSREKYESMVNSFRSTNGGPYLGLQRLTIVTTAGELEVKPVIGVKPDFVSVGKNYVYDMLIKLKVIK